MKQTKPEGKQGVSRDPFPFCCGLCVLHGFLGDSSWLGPRGACVLDTSFFLSFFFLFFVGGGGAGFFPHNLVLRGVPRTQKLRTPPMVAQGYQGFLLPKPGVDQDIALHAAPALQGFYLVSTFPIHSA